MKIRDMFTGKIRDVHIIGFDKRNKGKKSNCKCHHPRFSGNTCTYRTCRHTTETHYKISLPHDNDTLDNGIFILSNVEAEIKRHPDHFKELADLLVWINEGIAKCHCDFSIRRQDLRFYRNHDNGLMVPYQDTKCWIFSHCPKCGYDYNFQKIMRQKDWHHIHVR